MAVGQLKSRKGQREGGGTKEREGERGERGKARERERGKERAIERDGKWMERGGFHS